MDVDKGKFMKKVILGLIILVVVGGSYYFLTNLDAVIKAAIEKHGSAATQTAVRVDKVRVKLTDGVKTGTGSIKGLTIANPKGFAVPYVFSLGEITLGIDLQSLKEEPYVVSEVTVLAPEVFIEINDDRKVNLNELKRRLVSDKPQTKQSQTSTQSNAAEPRLNIRKLVFAKGNIIVKVVPLNNKEYKLKLPSIIMTNVGGKAGATPTELTKEILNRVIEQAKKEFQKSSYGLELERLKSEAKAKLNAAKAKAKAKLEAEKSKAKAKVDTEKEKLKQKTDSKLDAEKQKAKDKLKNLFGN